jgi:uncharacterized protein YpmS
LKINWYEDVCEQVKKLSQTPEFVEARPARNKIEALFSELRNQIRLCKVRLRSVRKGTSSFSWRQRFKNVKSSVRFLNQSK